MSEDVDPRDTPIHPRKRLSLIGHEDAEAKLRAAYASQRMHHAWMITGPRGIGKATLAYRFARFILRYPNPEQLPPGNSLAVPGEDLVARWVASSGHPDMITVERAYEAKKLRIETSVTEARRAESFFERTAAEGGYRICAIDSADDLSIGAANALLKTIEEPPSKSLFLIVTHSPGKVLRTLRSRCIRLDLSPLTPSQVAQVVREVGDEDAPRGAELDELAVLAGGSPGRALELSGSIGAKAFQSFLTLAAKLPRLDSIKRFDIAEQLTGRAQDSDFTLFCELLGQWVADTARRSAMENRVSAGAWAEAHVQIAHSIRVANALNLDRRQVILEAFSAIESAAGV
ncbi:MAG: DNA polymerase III subunit delta' [Aestuariivirgaceae bacterium]|nr:DNA polymerase III subunit delta' [Aestuariivirgaceae bacterium]